MNLYHRIHHFNLVSNFASAASASTTRWKLWLLRTAANADQAPSTPTALTDYGGRTRLAPSTPRPATDYGGSKRLATYYIYRENKCFVILRSLQFTNYNSVERVMWLLSMLFSVVFVLPV